MSFWNKLRSILTSMGVGTEVALYANDADPIWKVIILVVTLTGILITHIIEDNNNDGIADVFQ